MSRNRKKAISPGGRDRRQGEKRASAASELPDLAGSAGRASGPPTSLPRERQTAWLAAAALVVAVFLVYQPAWRGGFVWDDDTHLLKNPVLQPGGWLRTWVPGTYANYWPLTSTVYRIEYALWDGDTLGYHLVNIALHAASALLVWRVLARLKIPGALLAAAIFALHPVSVESVAWITQLKNTLSLPLALLAVLVYFEHERDGGWWRLALSLGLFLLSGLAKGMVLTLPIVLLACAWWQRGSIGRRDLLRILPFFMIAGVMVGMEVFQQHFAGSLAVRSDGLLDRAVVAGCAVWFYLWKVIWPADLMFVYPRWTIGAGDFWAYLPGLLLVALLAMAWWRRRSWGRPVIMLIVCYVALLLPALGFVNIFFMQYSLVSDHWQYAAMIVPCAAVAALLTTRGRRLPPLARLGRGAGGEGSLPPLARSGRGAGGEGFLRPPLGVYALSLPLLAILAMLSFRQSRMFADEETLDRTTLERNPTCWLMQNNFGNLLSAQADSLAAQGRSDAATAGYDEAIRHYHQALQAEPGNADTHLNLGNALARLGRLNEAIDEFQQALDARPAYVHAACSLARALAQQSRFEEAISRYHAALGINGGDLEALNELAWLRATCPEGTFRNGSEAVSVAEYARRLSKGRDPVVLDTLAAAYAEAGRFPEAMQAGRKALDYATLQHNSPLAEKIKARLLRYVVGKPFHQSAPKPASGEKTPPAGIRRDGGKSEGAASP